MRLSNHPPIDLGREMAWASAALTYPAVKVLRERFRVPAAVCARLVPSGAVGLASMTIEAGGARWTPEGPDRRLVIAVGDEFGQLIDLVAVASHDPQEWALRTGEGVMLGADAIDEAGRAQAAERRLTVRVFSNPIDWLAGCLPDGNGLRAGGVCMVEVEAGLRALRGMGEHCTLVVDRRARERMKALLAFGGLPQVHEVAPAMGVAA